MSVDPKKPTKMLGDEYIGYKSPPKRSQFLPGQSGNPAGRRRTKNAVEPPTSDDLNLAAYEKSANVIVSVTIGGEPRRMTRRDAFFEMLWSKALAGDGKALSIVAAREAKVVPADSPDDGPRCGVLVVSPMMEVEEWEARYGGPRPQPTLPILEKFRAELGMPPTNAGLPGFDDAGEPLPGHDTAGRPVKK